MKDWKVIYQYALAGLIVVAFFVVLLVMIFQDVSDNPVMNVMVGTLGTVTVMVASYYYGSSKGSSDKNDMLKK